MAVLGLAWAGATVAMPNAVAAGDRIVANDDRVAQLAGGFFLFDRAVEDQVIVDPAVVSEFRRIGLFTACSIYNRGLVEVKARHGPQFTRVLVDSVRAHVPPAVLESRTNFGWESGAMMAYRKRILTDLERNAGAILALAREELLARVLVGAAVEMDEGPVRMASGFEDWDLERPLARKTACHLLAGRPENLAARKSAFDGFFVRRVVN
ncbi:MAG TPA: hypothetical protein VFQ67_09020 [Allosphingosinicella sp.]|jgi:hypothetical protein|nr:hypothetical protein [Allosphingosinicella sp.]